MQDGADSAPPHPPRGVRRFLSTDRAATDPVLVIAAIAVSLVLLVGGGFTVSALISTAQDSNARQDAGRLATAERTTAADTGSFTDTLSRLTTTVTPSEGVQAGLVAGDSCFAAFTKSQTGRLFAATSARAALTEIPTPWSSSPPAGWPEGCAWPSSATDALSTRVTNQVPNPVGALAPDGYSEDLGAPLGSVNLTQASGVPVPSGRGIAVTPAGATNGDTALTFGDETGTRDTFRLGMRAGHTYTISGSLYLPSPQAGPTFLNRARGITFFSTGGTFTELNSPSAPNTTGVHHVSLTVTVPTNATNAFVRFYNGSSSAADTVVWTEMMVTEGTTDFAFGSGDSPGWSWVGAPNRSPSTGRTTIR
jgi:hypothetical protein